MLQTDFMDPGRVGGPPPPNAYKRAVYRSPPANFDVEVLPPRKMGSSYAYGMRIMPIFTEEDIKTESIYEKTSTKSSRSGGSAHSEYVVWRRWDDCLWFQELLELEYSVQSREKRRRLAQGKGVKKNGVYINTALASSFDSLPPGPDPTSIAKDIHDLVPKLTKKGTLFRASEATVAQRQEQFSAMIQSLFKDDLPTLIKELRDSRNIRDFFGYWRRDKDFERKATEERRGSSAGSTASPWSLYFSASTLSLHHSTDAPPNSAPSQSPNSPQPHSAHPLVMRRDSGYAGSEQEPPSPRGPPKSAPAKFGHGFMFSPKRSNLSSSSSDESDHLPEIASGRESRNSTLMAFPTSPTIQEHPLYPESLYDHSPNSEGGLASLPENVEFVSTSKLDIGDQIPPPVRRARSSSMSDKKNRNCVIFNDSPPSTPIPSRLTIQTGIPQGPGDSPLSTPKTSTNTTTNSSRYSSMFSVTSSRRSSWQTSISDLPVRPSSSQSQYTSSCIDMDRSITDSPTLPITPWAGADGFPRERPQSTYSVAASINSVMTDSSVDRVLPRSSRQLYRSFSNGTKKSRPYSQAMSVPEEDIWSEPDDDLLDSYFQGAELSSLSIDTESSGDSAHRERISQCVPSDQFPKPFQNRPPGQFHIPWSPPMSSPQSPSSPSSSVLSGGLGDTVAIKVVLGEDSIVMFRISVTTSFSEIRQKIYDKFVRQEGLPMSGSFYIGYVMTATTSPRGPSSGITGRTRSGSVSSSVTGVDVYDPLFRYINSEEEWYDAIRSCGSKLTLRVFESS